MEGILLSDRSPVHSELLCFCYDGKIQRDIRRCSSSACNLCPTSLHSADTLLRHTGCCTLREANRLFDSSLRRRMPRRAPGEFDDASSDVTRIRYELQAPRCFYSLPASTCTCKDHAALKVIIVLSCTVS